MTPDPRADLTSADALRSLRRYTALALGSDWEVRLTFEEGSFERPFAVVARAGPVLSSGGSRVLDVLCPFVVQAYPVVGSSMDESLVAAEITQEKLFGGFGRGIDAGRTSRIPFYDYQGLAVGLANTEAVPHRFMRVEDLSVEISGSPDDARLYIVHCDVRVAWRRAGWIAAPGPAVSGTGVTVAAH